MSDSDECSTSDGSVRDPSVSDNDAERASSESECASTSASNTDSAEDLYSALVREFPDLSPKCLAVAARCTSGAEVRYYRGDIVNNGDGRLAKAMWSAAWEAAVAAAIDAHHHRRLADAARGRTAGKKKKTKPRG